MCQIKKTSILYYSMEQFEFFLRLISIYYYLFQLDKTIVFILLRVISTILLNM